MNVVTSTELQSRPAALIVGHPGHELRAWGWMQATRPIVAVLTDGGGSADRPRMHLTRELCEAAGARLSNRAGMCTDQAIYRAMLDGRHDFFVDVSNEWAEMLIDQGIECVLGDASEGYNPTHDLCRSMIDRAVRIARRIRHIESYSLALVGGPVRADSSPRSMRLDLDAATLTSKLAAGRRYAEAVGGTLLGEIDDLLARFGEQAFAHEYFDAVDPKPVDCATAERPYYETYGERQVAAGHYAFVIRRDEHVAPIMRALAT